MAAYKENNFNERAKAAAEAKKAMAAKFRALPRPDDPIVQKRQAELLAIEQARAARAAEREAARKLEAERVAAEKAAELAAQAALAEEARKLEAEAAARAVALEAERKAARDRRYAARKARR